MNDVYLAQIGIQFIVLASIVVGIWGYLIWKQRTWRKASDGKCLVRMYPNVGMIQKGLCTFEDEMIKIRYQNGKIVDMKTDPKLKDEGNYEQEIYFADAHSTSPTLWPHETGFWSAFSINVPEVAFRQGIPEPLSQREPYIDTVIGTPKMIASRLSRAFASAMNMSQAEAELERQKNRDLVNKIPNLWVIYGAMIAGIAGVAVSLYFNYGMQGNMDKIMMGLGLK